MFKARIPENTVLVENTNIALTPIFNTNRNTVLDTTLNAVQIREPGYYDVYVSLPLTNASDSPLTVQLFANGQAIPEAVDTSDLTVTTGILTFHVTDVIRVLPAAGQYANVSVRVIGGTADLADDGSFIVERRK